MTAARLSHKSLGNFSATFEIFGNFLEFWQLLEFSATLGLLRFFEATFSLFEPHWSVFDRHLFNLF